MADKKTSSIPLPVMIIVGLGLMYGGFQASAMSHVAEGENFFKTVTILALPWLSSAPCWPFSR
jgi:hypothetical protein